MRVIIVYNERMRVINSHALVMTSANFVSSITKFDQKYYLSKEIYIDYF